MRVVIAGAGLGGLVLAQALRDAADVVVLDRDSAAGDTGGYRIALTPEAVAVIERHLPAGVIRRIREVSDGPATFRHFTIADARLRPLVVAAEPEDEDRLLCQRRALRTLLTEGLGDRLRFGATAVSAEAFEGGAAVTLADGTRITGDVVVAADGARSRIAGSIATQPLTEETGLTGIAGSAPLDGCTLPRYLLGGPALALDHRGLGMFLSLASHGIRDVPPDLAAAVGPPSLVWGLTARSEVLEDIAGASPEALARRAIELVAEWHPWLGERIAATDPARTAAFTFFAARPDRPRFPWPACRITGVGDAVHAMPPTGGRAGSTAVRSAGALAESLLEDPDLDRALARYQARVDEWAVPAIDESLGPVRVIRSLRRPVLQSLARPLLAVAGSVGAARYRRAVVSRPARRTR